MNLYEIDNEILGCVDVETGERRMKNEFHWNTEKRVS